MKYIYYCLVALCFYVLSCYARCNCDANDNICMSKCVVEANSCVTSCKGNIECYENCIDDKWPAAEASQEEENGIPRFNDVLATTTVSYTVTATSSVSASASGSASVSAKQGEASNSHVSAGSAVKVSAMVPVLAITIFYVLI